MGTLAHGLFFAIVFNLNSHLEHHVSIARKRPIFRGREQLHLVDELAQALHRGDDRIAISLGARYVICDRSGYLLARLKFCERVVSLISEVRQLMHDVSLDRTRAGAKLWFTCPKLWDKL